MKNSPGWDIPWDKQRGCVMYDGVKLDREKMEQIVAVIRKQRTENLGIELPWRIFEGDIDYDNPLELATIVAYYERQRGMLERRATIRNVAVESSRLIDRLEAMTFAFNNMATEMKFLATAYVVNQAGAKIEVVRKMLRKNKQFDASDALRDILNDLSCAVKDTKL